MQVITTTVENLPPLRARYHRSSPSLADEHRTYAPSPAIEIRTMDNASSTWRQFQLELPRTNDELLVRIGNHEGALTVKHRIDAMASTWLFVDRLALERVTDVEIVRWQSRSQRRTGHEAYVDSRWELVNHDDSRGGG